MSEKDREVSESIKKLKILSVVDGRVSISPSEVVTEEFIKERKEARRQLSASMGILLLLPFLVSGYWICLKHPRLALSFHRY